MLSNKVRVLLHRISLFLQVRLQKNRKIKLSIIGFSIIGLLVIISVLFFQPRNQKREIQDIILYIGQFMELPEEEPVLATVNDPTKLQTQSFFQKAKSGDKLLIFSQSRLAILYRPETKKVISVAPIAFTEQKVQ